MYRRLFFLLPDKAQTLQAVQHLVQADVKPRQMHCLSAPGVDLSGLPQSSPNQRRDMHAKIEDSLWHLNMGIFLIALLVLVLSFIGANYFLVFSSLAVMLATYLVGYFYLNKPTVHLSGFHAAFKHGEVLLMVDVPKNQVADIEQLIMHNDPAASEEGMSWASRDLSMQI